MSEANPPAHDHDLAPAPDPQWHFSDASAVQALRTEAASWLGTPYYKFSCVKGPEGGVDCAGLIKPLFLAAGIGSLYIEQGILFDFARTEADYQSHRTELRILKIFRGEFPQDPQSAALREIFAELPLPDDKENLDPSLFLPGDLLVLRSGGQFHLPIMLDGRRFIHCFRPYGVQYGDIHDPTYSKPLDAHFRARARLSSGGEQP